MALRLAVVDDGAFVRTYAGEIRPVDATFNRFVEAVARTGAFARVRYVIPVRNQRIWEVEPALGPVDESAIEAVPTAAFSGIGDYLARAGWIMARNRGPIDRAIADSDLVWLRLPASNALLALTSARLHGVQHFGWVAGSARAVAAAQSRPAGLRELATAIGSAYDAVTELCGQSGLLIHLDGDLFASTVSDAEVADTHATVFDNMDGARLRIAWSGRMGGEKGLIELAEAFGALIREGRKIVLVLIGDGPSRPAVERALAPLAGDVEDYGFVGDRATYMQLLRGADVFVHPSAAEGVPKVLVDAMAAGLPIVASDAGSVAAVLGHGDRGRLVAAGDTEALTRSIRDLLDDRAARAELRQHGLDWVREHTAEAQASRLVDRLREEFPRLAWPS